MSKPNIVPKKFPFTIEVTPEMLAAMKFLKEWKQNIDDRLFREGFEMRDGQLYEIGFSTPVESETYWQKHWEIEAKKRKRK